MNSKREERAIDALLVSQLRSDRENVDSLPELSELEREAIDSLGPDFVSRLLAGQVVEVPLENDMEHSKEIACGPAFGLNRAKDIDDVTREELDRKRQAIIDQLNRKNGEPNDGHVSE
jgi:hypothetical protein